MRMQPMVIGHHYMASAGQYLATEAAHAILRAGGNADRRRRRRRHRARRGAQRPGPVLRRRADAHLPRRTRRDRVHRRPRLVAQGAATSSTFIREHGGTIPLGILRTVVPAAPDAWILALQRYGTMSFGEVAASAIRYARDGFAVHTVMATFLAGQGRGLSRWPQNTAIYLPRRRAAARRRPARAGRSRPHDPVHGRPGEGGGGAGAAMAGLRGGARRLLSRRHRARRSSQYHRENGGLLTARGSRRVPLRDRGAAALHASRAPTC